MPSPRIRRLQLDYQLLTSRLANWPVIQITGTAGIPPEIYRIAYHLQGLYVAPGGEILERAAHVMEINLSLGYPRRAPQCRMLTPVFHPNFDEAQVCIGDFWAASEGLDDLVVRVGRMICYQEYNTKSPLNGLAAKWVEQNVSLLPIDSRNVAPPAANGVAPRAPASEAQVALANSVPSAGEAAAHQTPSAAPSEAVSSPSAEDPWSQKISIS